MKAARKLFVSLGPLVLVPLAAWALASCATVITPPSSVSDPVDVFVVDHGRTTSLVLPAPDGALIRYAYGDWEWYALGKHGAWRGAAALFWPTEGALGRGLLTGPATIENVREQVPAPEEILSIAVERVRLIAFETRMQALYDAGRDTAVSNPEAGMTFVHHPQRYTIFRNSNHAVASWLRELGCETRGVTIGANWRVSSTPR
jgi:hypothetical protein